MDEIVGLLCVVAAFAVWLTAAVYRAMRDAEWGEPENGRLDRLARPGLDTPAKREAALRYLDTLEGMAGPDPVTLERIAKQRSMLRHPAGKGGRA